MEEDDGRIERLIRLSTLEDAQSSDGMLGNNLKKSLWDDHIWLSVGYRQSPSTFTRVQRLSCCVTILFLTMVTNAMFFGTGDSGAPQNGFQLGPISLTVHQLYTSVASSVIVVPPLILITWLFANSREKQEKTLDDGKYDAPSDCSDDEEDEDIWSVGEEEERKKRKLDAGKQSKAKKKPFAQRKLPHWCIYIAYVLVFLAVASSAFFTVLYAFQWGRTKSEEWLVTFFLSFSESVFVMQPVKVRDVTNKCLICNSS